MQIRLSDHFSFGRLLRFTLPSIAMMILTSLYSVADGLFVSNMIGDIGLSAVNIMFPVAMLISAVGFMLGTGGSAVVARTLGEGRPDMANRFFSMFVFAVILFGGILSAAGAAFVEPIARLAGASDILMDSCVSYGRILFAGSLPFMLQTSLQPFFVVAEKPNMGLILSIASGVTNFAGDWVLIQLLGLPGAAWATVAGYCVGGIIPLVFFITHRSGLHLTATGLYIREFLQACGNGASELMSNISSSLVGILYNLELMRLVGERGVAAHSVMMYVDFVFIAAFLGFSIGSAPIISYHFGANNHDELKNVFRRSMFLIFITSGAMVVLSEALCRPLCAAFVGYSPRPDAAHRARLPPVRAVLSVLRRKHLCVGVLHRAVQRRAERLHLLPAFAAAARRSGPPASARARSGRRMARRCRGRGSFRRRLGGAPVAAAHAVSLSLRQHRTMKPDCREAAQLKLTFPTDIDILVTL